MKLSKAISLFREAKSGTISELSVRWYNARLTSLLDFLGDMDIKDITVPQLRRWRTPDNGYVRAARALFNWLEAKGLLEKNPAQIYKAQAYEK